MNLFKYEEKRISQNGEDVDPIEVDEGTPNGWEKLKDESILYAGDLTFQLGSGATLGAPIDYSKYYKNCIGLSLTKNDNRHIKHDITKKIPLKDNSIMYFQAEDVFEHIEYHKIYGIINEIHRILKPNGIFRLSVPDYRYDVHVKRTKKDEHGNFLFDPIGGGKYDEQSKKVVGGGHVWFPLIEKIKPLYENSLFKTQGEINYLHYYDEDGTPVLNDIDYSTFFVMRTPDHEKRATNPRRPASIVIDAIKKV